MNRSVSKTTAPFTFSRLDERTLEHCNRCGFCLAVCPTYQETGVETQSPRGRIALMLAASRGELSWGEGLRRHLYHCLDCRACETICPAGVRVGDMIVAARARVEAAREPSPWRSLVLRGLLPHPNLLELAAWPLRLYQRLGLRRLLRASGLLRFLPQRLRLMEALLPQLPRRPLRRQLPRVTPARGERRYRVGYFLGCAMSLIFAEAGRATVGLLSSYGCEVFYPRSQKCCGAPHQDQGDAATLRALARHNLAVFADESLDYIVSDCAACSAMLKDYARILGDDPAWGLRAQAFAARVRDASELLYELGAAVPLGPANGRLRLTYHEPCHLRHAQGVAAPPRALLASLSEATFTELPESDTCCGSAGVYLLTHPERSLGLMKRKMRHVVASGAEVVATANPGCLLQLRLAAEESGQKLRVAHISELLAEAHRRLE